MGASSFTAMTSYLAREEAAHADDAQDVEDGRPHNGAHSHVTFGNENTWRGGGVKLSQSAQMKVYNLTLSCCKDHKHKPQKAYLSILAPR